MNLSVSGASIKVDFDLKPLSKIEVVIDLPQRSRCDAPSIAAYVARTSHGTVGIEWCKFAPSDVSSLLHAFSSRRHIRLRKPEKSSAIAISRLSALLLKHAT